jgi:hypothetical protein
MNYTSPYLQIHFIIIFLYAGLYFTCPVSQERSPPELNIVFSFYNSTFETSTYYFTYLLTPRTLLHGMVTK